MSSASSASSDSASASAAPAAPLPLSNRSTQPRIDSPASREDTSSKSAPELDENSDSELVEEADVEYCKCADEEIEAFSQLSKLVRGTILVQSLLIFIYVHTHVLLYCLDISLQITILLLASCISLVDTQSCLFFWPDGH
jgi:hypothetical protein